MNLREWVEQLVRELLRSERERGDSMVWRRAKVTAVDTDGRLVQTTVSGEAWLEYPVWWNPTAGSVGTVVEVVEQGPGLTAVWNVLT